MPKIDVERDFRREGKWILPVRGTLGRKAQNLIDNGSRIDEVSCQIPNPSLVIPYEYYWDTEGGMYNVLDWINHFFPDVPLVGVSSNSPDEDVGERRPGMYASRKIEHLDRRESYQDLQAVIHSYGSPFAKSSRKKLGLPEQGMSLLVRPFISADFSGAFSFFGDKSLITFTNPRKGMDSMQSPSEGKVWADSEGKIIGTADRHVENVKFAERFHRLAKSLPKIPGKGWEIEFLATRTQFSEPYIMQTTPIKQQPRFEVKSSEKDCLSARDIIGFGAFPVEGILYMPALAESELDNIHNFFSKFENIHPNYALATVHANIKRGIGDKTGAKVLIDVCTYGGYHPLSAHLSQKWRETGAAFSGYFTNSLGQYVTDGLYSTPGTLGVNERGRLHGMLYSPTKMVFQSDEFEMRSCAEVVGEVQPFQRVVDIMKSNPA